MNAADAPSRGLGMRDRLTPWRVVAVYVVDQDRLAHSRRSTADRILDALATRDRVSGRRTIEGMLTDLRDGVCSVLERGYRYRVARPHGLPPARRQHASRATGRPAGGSGAGRRGGRGSPGLRPAYSASPVSASPGGASPASLSHAIRTSPGSSFGVAAVAL